MLLLNLFSLFLFFFFRRYLILLVNTCSVINISFMLNACHLHQVPSHSMFWSLVLMCEYLCLYNCKDTDHGSLHLCNALARCWRKKILSIWVHCSGSELYSSCSQHSLHWQWYDLILLNIWSAWWSLKIDLLYLKTELKLT